MCFRPAEVEPPQVCPECGKEIAIIGGVKQKKCPFCGADMPESAAPGVAAPGAPGAPAAPAAPAAPGAPKA